MSRVAKRLTYWCQRCQRSQRYCVNDGKCQRCGAALIGVRRGEELPGADLSERITATLTMRRADWQSIAEGVPTVRAASVAYSVVEGREHYAVAPAPGARGGGGTT